MKKKVEIAVLWGGVVAGGLCVVSALWIDSAFPSPSSDPDALWLIQSFLMMVFGVGILSTAAILGRSHGQGQTPDRSNGLWKKVGIAVLAILGSVLVVLGLRRFGGMSYTTCYMRANLDRMHGAPDGDRQTAERSTRLAILSGLKERGAVSAATFYKVVQCMNRRPV